MSDLSHRAEDQRILLIGHLGRLDVVMGQEPRLLIRRRELPILVQRGRARAFQRGNGPLRVADAFHLLVRGTVEIRAKRAHLIPDLLGVLVVHGISHAGGQLAEDLPIVLALPFGRHGGGEQLEGAIRR